MANYQDLQSKGLWDGPNKRLKDQLRYMYELIGSPNWIGVFSSRFEDNQNTIYLGHTGADGQLYVKVKDEDGQEREECVGLSPTIGRDKVRTPEGHLKVLSSPDQLKPEYNAAWYKEYDRNREKSGDDGIIKKIRPSSSLLVLYPLCHDRQVGVIEPSTFDGYTICINGGGPLGLHVTLLLTKMGIRGDSIYLYESLEVEATDTCLAMFRSFDVKRPRATAVKEIILDQTLEKIHAYGAQITADVDLGNIVINTSSDQDRRRSLWGYVRKSQGTGLYIDAQIQGEQGMIYVINPQDEVSIQMYEESLRRGVVRDDAVSYAVSVLAGMIVCAIKRYVTSASNGKDACLDRVYPVSLPAFFQRGGAVGKARS